MQIWNTSVITLTIELHVLTAYENTHNAVVVVYGVENTAHQDNNHKWEVILFIFMQNGFRLPSTRQ